MIEQSVQLWRIPENNVSQESLDKKIAILRDRLQHIQQNNQQVRFATSLAVEDMVLTDAIATHHFSIEIFTLNTGRLHQETLDMISRCESHYQISIKKAQPLENGVTEFVRQYGINGFYDSEQAKKACCHARKIEPLNRMLKGADAWITGQRKEQAVTRE